MSFGLSRSEAAVEIVLQGDADQAGDRISELLGEVGITACLRVSCTRSGDCDKQRRHDYASFVHGSPCPFIFV